MWLGLARLTFFQGLDLRDAAVYEPLTSVGNSYFGNMGFILAPSIVCSISPMGQTNGWIYVNSVHSAIISTRRLQKVLED
jgi:hypothetical protein